MVSTTKSSLVSMAQSWGWTTPTRDVINLAQMAHQYGQMLSGEALKKLNIISASEIEELLKDKPEDVKLLEYVVSKNPIFRPHIDKILTLKKGLPFYDHLDKLFQLHPLMDDQKIYEACENLDAVLLTAENCPAVLIFSTFKQLVSYDTAGREYRSTDPIRAALLKADKPQSGKVYLGLGPRDQIIKHFVKATVNFQQDTIDNSQIWYSESAEGPIQKTIVKLLDTCIINQATDLRLVPVRNGGATPMMRVNGDYIGMPIQHIKKDDIEIIKNFLMARSGADIKSQKKVVPTDGQMTYQSNCGQVFLRFSFIPLNHSDRSDQDIQSIAIRIFMNAEVAIDLKDLHLNDDIIKQISTASQFDNGLIVFVGATGSGKSSSIAGAINENVKHYGTTRSRISIEQPVERYLPNITQINVNDVVKKDERIVDGFELNLRAIKRHDPDVIWVGEIRDAETANTCVASATSGHLVYATLHANNTIVGYDTLLTKVSFDYRFQLIESLSLIVAQQLLKHVCPHCKIVGKPSQNEVEYFEAITSRLGLHSTASTTDSGSSKRMYQLPASVSHANPKGCDYVSQNGQIKCSRGYIGVLPVNEILVVTYEVKNAMISFLHTGNIEHKKTIEKARHSTMFESAFKLLTEGKIEVRALTI